MTFFEGKIWKIDSAGTLIFRKKNPGNSDKHPKLRLAAMAIFFMLTFQIFLGITTAGVANAAWPDCNWQCPAQDVVMTRVWLGDAAGNDLSECTVGDPVTAYVWGRFVNTANSARYTVMMEGDFLIDGVSQGLFDLCVLDAIPGSSTTTAQLGAPFQWTCGSRVELSADTVIAWQTNVGVCAGFVPECNDFPPAKCWQGDGPIVVEPPPFVDLNIVKTHSKDPVAPGDSLTYTISYSNSGNTDATNVVITETYDSNVTFDSATPSPDSGDNVWNIGTLAPGGSGTISVTVTVSGGISVPNTIVNDVEIESDTAGPVTAQETTAVIGQPLFEISKGDSPDPVQAGGLLTYTVNYSNTGNAGATGVVITETYDSNVTFDSATPDPSNLGSGNNIWNIGALAAGASGSITITVRVASPLPNGTLLDNNVSLTANEGSALAQQVTTVQSNPILNVSKVHSADPIEAGEDLTYTITYSNSSTANATATNVVITDTYDSNVTFVSATPAPDVGNNQWNIGSLAPGASGTISITVNVNKPLQNGTLLVNNVQLTSDQGNTSAQETTEVQSQPLLQITKSDSPDPVSPNQLLTYTLNYDNDAAATSDATGVVITETYDSNVTFVSATPAPDVGNNQWNIGTIIPGGSGSISITVRVNTPLPNGTLLNNSVVISANEGSANAQETTAVQSSPSLNLTKIDSPDPVEPNGILTYTLNYSNDTTGTEAATNVVITETYDSNVTFVSATPAPDVGNNQWNIGSLAPGDNGTIIIQVQVKTPLPNGTILTNQAVMNSDQGNIFATETTTVQSAPVLAINKVHSKDPVKPGENLTYTITYSNGSSASETATNVVMTETYDSNVTFVSANPAPDVGNNQWNIGTLAPGASGTITVTVLVKTPLPDGTALLNTVVIAADQGSAEAQEVTVVESSPTLTINKIHSQDPVSPGDNLTYTITYSNVGNDAAFNVVITETYDSNVTFVSATPSPDSGDNKWNIGTLAAGATGILTVVVNVNTPLPDGTQILNNVQIISNRGGASAQEVTIVDSNPILSINKIHSHDPVRAGENLTYTITYANSSDASETATNVVITETYDSNVTFVSATPAPDVGNNQWNVGTLTPGVSGTITVTVKVNSPLSDGTQLLNSVLIQSDQGSANAQEVTVVESNPVLVISKIHSADPVKAGDNLTYTITYSNESSASETATSVVIIETYDPNVTFVSATPAPDVGNNQWNIGTLAPGAFGTITVTVKVNSPLPDGTQILNGVQLNSDQGSTHAEEVTRVESNPILSISKTSSPDPVRAGDNLTYTINYANASASSETATNVVITETYDSNVTFVSAAPAPDVGNNQWNIGSLSPGATGSITVTVKVNTPLTNGTQLLNSVLIQSDQGSATAQEITVVESNHTFTISKTGSPDPVRPGQDLTYTINYSNLASSTETATNVVITETYDSNVTFISASPSPSVGNNQWNIGNLAPGASGSITVTVNVNSNVQGGTKITNTVVIQSDRVFANAEEETTVESNIPPPIPTLNEWGFLLFATLTVLAGLWMFRTRRETSRVSRT